MKVRVNVVQIGKPDNRASFIADHQELIALKPHSGITLGASSDPKAISGRWNICAVHSEFALHTPVPGDTPHATLSCVTVIAEPTASSFIPE